MMRKLFKLYIFYSIFFLVLILNNINLFSAVKLKITKTSGDTKLYWGMVYNFKIEALNSDNSVDTNYFGNVKVYSSMNNDIEIIEGSSLEGGDQILTIEQGVISFGILCKKPETVTIYAESFDSSKLTSYSTNILFNDYDYSDNKIVINEIMYRYSSGNGNRQWIELYNNSNNTINLQNMILYKITPSTSHSTNSITLPSININKNSYYVLINDTSYFTGDFPDLSSDNYQAVITSSSFLSSTKGILKLVDTSGKVVDIMFYNDSDYDLDYMQSLERVNPNFPSYDENNWSGCVDTTGISRGVKGTPGRQNSVYKSSEDNSEIIPEINIALSKNIFDLSENNLLKIDISANLAVKVDIKVFDSTGTELKKIKNEYQIGVGETTVYYDGKDENGNKLKSGIYFIYVKYINDKTGHYGRVAKNIVIVNGGL